MRPLRRQLAHSDGRPPESCRARKARNGSPFQIASNDAYEPNKDFDAVGEGDGRRRFPPQT